MDLKRLAFALIGTAACAATARAAPLLTLTAAGTSLTGKSVTQGTAQLAVDLALNSDGRTVSGLQYYLTISSAAGVKYATPVAVTNSPFVAADVALTPATGAAVASGAAGTTVFFKAAGADYAAFNGKFAAYTLSIASVPIGVYAIGVVGQELSNSANTVTTFAVPGSFALTVTAVPEPAFASALGAAAALFRRRRQAGRAV